MQWKVLKFPIEWWKKKIEDVDMKRGENVKLRLNEVTKVKDLSIMVHRAH